MAGTKIGGQKAAATNKLKRGLNWYREIGRIGGRNGHTGGFAANPELAKIAGQKGGRISKRGSSKKSKKDELRDIEREIKICKEVSEKEELLNALGLIGDHVTIRERDQIVYFKEKK